MSLPPTATETVLPYRAWWGLLGCAAFMALVLAAAPYSAGVNIGPDQGNFWYYWQRADANLWSRLAAWVPYCLHQVSIWYLIANARQARPKYVFGLHSFNLWALGVNAFFMVLHVVQTRVSYDGLAQDVHEATSMGSVILMLFLIMLMENRRRGMFFGKQMPFVNTAGDIVRRYHGFYFSWAIVYTFWYHPVETTPGHLAGYAYMSLLLLQSSLFFTRYHVNRWWTMFLEILFVIHGALIAWFVMNPGDHQFWSMFMFGGIGIFLVTHLHGLGLSTRGKWAIAAPLLAVLAVFYGTFPQYLIGLPRLAVILYSGAALMAALIWPVVLLSRSRSRGPVGAL